MSDDFVANLGMIIFVVVVAVTAMACIYIVYYVAVERPAYVVSCRAAGGDHVEEPRGIGLTCWNTTTGKRLFIEGGQ